jgi:3-deoxy-7-phosphoheptulonate synthase
MDDWTPTSWQSKPTLQQPVYPDAARLEEALRDLAHLPPLVTSWEIERLKSQLAEAACGRRFLLQGGDCAERFSDCTSAVIANKLKILLQMSLVLTHGLRKKIIRVGRFAGQYAKPRSEDFETRDGLSLPSYRGELVNRAPFTLEDRMPNPDLLLRGYERAALTINFIRSLIDGGFADLHHPEYWDLDWVQHSPLAEEYHRIVNAIGDSLSFLEQLGGQAVGETNRVDYFTSHEGLLLVYEQAQTRQVPHRKGWYNLSTHFPWIGMRTAQPGGAHVEFFRGINNPIGIKVGAGTSPETLVELAEILDPEREPGRLTFIQRHAPRGPAGPLDLRSDARQHRDDRGRLQNPPFRQHPLGAGAGVRHPRREPLLPRRGPLRADRRQRDRMRRRRPRPDRARPAALLPHAGRPAPQLRTGAGDGAADLAPGLAGGGTVVADRDSGVGPGVENPRLTKKGGPFGGAVRWRWDGVGVSPCQGRFFCIAWGFQPQVRPAPPPRVHTLGYVISPPWGEGRSSFFRFLNRAFASSIDFSSMK